MVTNRWLAFSAIIVTHIGVPLLLLAWIMLVPSSSWLNGILKFLIVLFTILWLSLAGYWTTFGYYLRYLWLPITVFAGFIALPTFVSKPLWAIQTPMHWFGMGIQVALLLGLIYQLSAIMRSYSYPTSAISLSLPFRHGTYGVSFGGNGRASSIMNYHYKASIHSGSGANSAMTFAVDIVKIQGWKMFRGWTFPSNNEGFVIFQEEVLSPCAGQVVHVENAWPDQKPFSLNRPYNPGNHVIVRTGEVEILLGHMQKDSFTVQTGDRVQIGSVLGRIGNSGFSDWPHIHIQATRVTSGTIWDGEGVPILFDGKNAIKNALFRR